MNTLNKRLISGLAATVLAAIYSQTAFAADATGNASATVLAPLAISENTAMDFGNVAGDSGSATTVVLTTAGATSSADGAYAQNGSGAAGVFDVTGATGLAYDINLPTVAVTLTSGANTMTVDTFTDDTGGTGTLVGGADSFNVGATLNIGAAQAAGAYSGTYTVTVNYQ